MKSMRLCLTMVALAVFSFDSVLESEAGVRTKRPCVPAKRAVCVKPKPKVLLGPKVSLIQENSLDGWVTVGGKTPGSAWEVVNGILHLNGRGGDIRTEKKYENFILDFAWTISKGGNSGIKYRFQPFEGKGWLGCEYQVLDDFNTGEGKISNRSAAALYFICPANDKKKLNPHTEMNRGRIVVHGDRLQHWLNGEKVVEVTVGSDQWNEALAKSKFNNVEGFGANAIGHIMLQDHQCEVWFHEIFLQEILAPKIGVPAKRTSTICVKSCPPNRLRYRSSRSDLVRCKANPCVKRGYRCTVPVRLCSAAPKVRCCR